MLIGRVQRVFKALRTGLNGRGEVSVLPMELEVFTNKPRGVCNGRCSSRGRVIEKFQGKTRKQGDRPRVFE